MLAAVWILNRADIPPLWLGWITVLADLFEVWDSLPCAPVRPKGLGRRWANSQTPRFLRLRVLWPPPSRVCCASTARQAPEHPNPACFATTDPVRVSCRTIRCGNFLSRCCERPQAIPYCLFGLANTLRKISLNRSFRYNRPICSRNCVQSFFHPLRRYNPTHALQPVGDTSATFVVEHKIRETWTYALEVVRTSLSRIVFQTPTVQSENIFEPFLTSCENHLSKYQSTCKTPQYPWLWPVREWPSNRTPLRYRPAISYACRKSTLVSDIVLHYAKHCYLQTADNSYPKLANKTDA